MNDKVKELAAKLIRNFNDAELASEVRPPLYDTMCTRLAAGTAATKLGASIDIVAARAPCGSPGNCCRSAAAM
jgi:hypothetical protein